MNCFLLPWISNAKSTLLEDAFISNRSCFDASVVGLRAMSHPHEWRACRTEQVLLYILYAFLVKRGTLLSPEAQRQLETMLSVLHTTSITFVFLRGL